MNLLFRGNLKGAKLLLWAISPVTKVRLQQLLVRRRHLQERLQREMLQRSKERRQLQHLEENQRPEDQRSKLHSPGGQKSGNIGLNYRLKFSRRSSGGSNKSAAR